MPTFWMGTKSNGRLAPAGMNGFVAIWLFDLGAAKWSPSDALRQREAEKLRYDQRKRVEEAREQQRQKLIAEYKKQHNTDCKDEKTLRYMQNLDRQRIGR